MASFFNADEDDFIKNNCMTMSLRDMAMHLGRSKYGCRNRMKLLGIKIPEEIIKQRCLDSLIKKGNIPPNKGKGMPEELREKIKHTWFKKGGLPGNTKYDSCITIRRETDGRPYKYIRIAKAKWVLYSRYVWEQVYGKIPYGMIISFKDKNTMNCDIENLELISKGENMKRNSIQNMPEEIKQSIRILNGFKRKVYRYEKKHK